MSFKDSKGTIMQSTRMWVAAAFAAAAMSGALAASALVKKQPAVVDLGAAESIAGQSQISVTVSLKLRNTDQMESLLQAVYTAGGPSYRNLHHEHSPMFLGCVRQRTGLPRRRGQCPPGIQRWQGRLPADSVGGDGSSPNATTAPIRS